MADTRAKKLSIDSRSQKKVSQNETARMVARIEKARLEPLKKMLLQTIHQELNDYCSTFNTADDPQKFDMQFDAECVIDGHIFKFTLFPKLNSNFNDVSSSANIHLILKFDTQKNCFVSAETNSTLLQSLVTEFNHPELPPLDENAESGLKRKLDDSKTLCFQALSEIEDKKLNFLIESILQLIHRMSRAEGKQQSKRLARDVLDAFCQSENLSPQQKIVGLSALQAALQLKPKDQNKIRYLFNLKHPMQPTSKLNLSVERGMPFSSADQQALNLVSYSGAVSFGIGIMLAAFAAATLLMSMPLTIVCIAATIGFLGMAAGAGLLKKHSIFSTKVEAQEKYLAYNALIKTSEVTSPLISARAN